jgi:hypothetical protein
MPARVDGRLHLGTDTEPRAATRRAAKLLRAEGQLETLAAGAHADVHVLDGDPLEDIGLLADPAAHIALVIQVAGMAVPGALAVVVAVPSGALGDQLAPGVYPCGGGGRNRARRRTR